MKIRHLINKEFRVKAESYWLEFSNLKLSENSFKLKETWNTNLWDSSKNFQETLNVIFVEKLPEINHYSKAWEFLIKAILVVAVLILSFIILFFIIGYIILIMWSLQAWFLSLFIKRKSYNQGRRTNTCNPRF